VGDMGKDASWLVPPKPKAQRGMKHGKGGRIYTSSYGEVDK